MNRPHLWDDLEYALKRMAHEIADSGRRYGVDMAMLTWKDLQESVVLEFRRETIEKIEH